MQRARVRTAARAEASDGCGRLTSREIRTSAKSRARASLSPSSKKTKCTTGTLTYRRRPRVRVGYQRRQGSNLFKGPSTARSPGSSSTKTLPSSPHPPTSTYGDFTSIAKSCCTAPSPAPASGARTTKAAAVGRRYDRIASVDGDKTHVYVVLESGEAYVKRIFLVPGSDAEYPDYDPDVARIWPDVVDYTWLPLMTDEAVDMARTRKILVTDVDCKADAADFNNGASFPLKLSHVSASNAKGVLWGVDSCGAAWTCEAPCLRGKGWKLAMSGGNLTAVDADQMTAWIVEDGAIAVAPVGVHAGTSDLPARELTFAGSLAATSGRVAWITASSNPEYTNEYAAYTVEANPGICATFADQIACDAQVDFNCKWYVDGATCEMAVPTSKSRLQDEEILFGDATCIDLDMLNADTGAYERTSGFAVVKETNDKDVVVKRDPGCLDDAVRKRYKESLRPACWDYNATVEANSTCRDTNGDVRKDCVTIGFSSTNFIVHCGGAYADDPTCGTFLEIHRVDDPEILADVRIAPKDAFTSGYRTMTMPLRYKGEDDRVVCRGQYELWWVQRTRKKRIVELKKKFFITYPTCDWNAKELAYYPYAIVR